MFSIEPSSDNISQNATKLRLLRGEIKLFEESRAFKQPPEPSLVTMTGEPYQPARLFYWVGQKNAVIGRFRRLRCIDEERTHNRWVWFLTEEAKKIKFTKSYRDIPKEHRPLVLDYFTFIRATNLI